MVINFIQIVMELIDPQWKVEFALGGSIYKDNTNNYYGILTKVVQLEYPALPIKRIVLFKCE